MEEKRNVCSGGPKLIFACSGAADVGAISDQAARKLTSDGVGQMFCLAGIGGRIEAIMQKSKTASQILAIDGCGLDCAKETLANAEIHNFKQLRVTDLGLEKGKSPVNEENINKVAIRGRKILQN